MSDLLNTTQPVATSPFGNASTESALATPASGNLSGMNWAIMLGGLAKALAPHNYNRFGHEVPSWQAGVGEMAQNMGQAQLTAKALGAPSTGAGGTLQLQALLKLLSNPMLSQSLFGTPVTPQGGKE